MLNLPALRSCSTLALLARLAVSSPSARAATLSLSSSKMAMATASCARAFQTASCWSSRSQSAASPTAASSSVEVQLENLTGNDAGIVVVTMQKQETRNSLSKVFIQQLNSAIDDIQNDSSARAVIVRSTVDKVFCAGADLKERLKMSESEVLGFVNLLRSTFSKLEAITIPTIAAIDGSALGGGLELALACDIRVAGETAKLGLPETKLAIIPGAGGTQRLPRVVGTARAKDLIFTGRVLDPETAAQYGLVQYAVKGPSYDKALEIAREILPKGPIAIKAAKAAIDKALEVDRATGFQIEQFCYSTTIPTKDRIEGLVAFQEKRAPKYRGN